jgi:AcrR family transcriptional regulator
MRTPTLKEETREAILDAAKRLAHRYGYRKMTMCDIAEEAGLSRPTVYLYFPNKEELALASLDRLHRQVIEQLEAVVNGSATPEEKLRAMLMTRVLFVYDRMPHDSQCLNDLFHSIRPLLLERREQWLQVEGQVFGGVLDAGKGDGSFVVADIPATARVLLTATQSLMPFSLSPRELGERDELEARARALADLLLKGVLARNPA